MMRPGGALLVEEEVWCGGCWWAVLVVIVTSLGNYYLFICGVIQSQMKTGYGPIDRRTDHPTDVQTNQTIYGLTNKKTDRPKGHTLL